METELYNIMYNKLLESGLSKRKFCEHFGIPHSWFIEFMNPDKPFRPMQIKTMALLHNKFGIDMKTIKAYNNSIKVGE